jgi:hypothetical protein
MPLPTPAGELRNGSAVSVSCNCCKRIAPLDIADMVACAGPIAAALPCLR